MLRRALEPYLAQSVSSVKPIAFRKLFEAYVGGLRKLTAELSGKTQAEQAVALKDAKKEVDLLLLRLLTMPKEALFKGDVENFVMKPVMGRSGLDGGPPLFPLYMAAPLSDWESVLQVSDVNAEELPDPSRREDIVLDSSAFGKVNVVQPYYVSVCKALQTSRFDRLHIELEPISHLRFVLPFTSMLETFGKQFDESDRYDSVSAQTSLSVLVNYLHRVEYGLRKGGHNPVVAGGPRRVEADTAAPGTTRKSRHHYWYAAPPISHVSFTQECDIIIATLNAARKEKEAAVKAGRKLQERPDPLDDYMNNPTTRLLQFTQYLQARNALKEQKARLLGGAAAAGRVIPVSLGTKDQTVEQLAFKKRVATNSLTAFVSTASSSLLFGSTSDVLANQSIGSQSRGLTSDVKALSEMMQRRSANFTSQK